MNNAKNAMHTEDTEMSYSYADVIEANSVFFQWYSHGEVADSGATSTNEHFSVHR